MTFTKSYDELIALGLPKTLALLYGRLERHAGKDGRCFPTHATLAREIRLKHRESVVRLLRQLRDLKLIEWKRGRSGNLYTVLPPDVTAISHQMEHSGYIRCNRDVTSGPPRTLFTEETHLRDSSKPPEAGRLAELIIEAWPKLPGHPGAKLIARIATILGDIPLAEFAALLQSKARKVQSFGLAESLARDLAERRNGDARAHEQHDVDKRGREDAQLAEQVKKLEAMRDDPIYAHDRAQIESMLADLKRTPKSETTTRARKGAA